MAGKEEYRIFVGGLSWEITERRLEDAFSRFGKIIESQIMLERDSGRPRGFGFITFADRRSMENAIRDMHGRELGDRSISVNKAQPRLGGGDDLGHSYGGGFSSAGGRGSSYVGGGDRSVGQDECFKCGRMGHWARECPATGGGRGSGGPQFSSRSRLGGGGRGDRYGGDRYGGDRYGGDRDRYIDDRYDGGRYGDKYHFDARDTRYGTRNRFVGDRYAPAEDRFTGDRYGGSDRYPQNGYGKERGYERDVAPRGGNDRYGVGGPARNEGRNYRSRADPYDRPSGRPGRPSSFDRY